MKIILLLFCFCNLILIANSQNNEIVTVKAVDFSDPSPEGWNAQYKKTVDFPDDNIQWAKIIVKQTLKCDEATKADTFPCGEWDYIWHAIILEPKGDSTEKFCLYSFVTPYGKRLKLGDNNEWTWFYDVTDYAPILKGTKEIIAGNNQELLDLEFYFYPGTPVRNVISIENIYPHGTYKYQYLAEDSVLKKKKIFLNPEANSYKLKARISGHGHAGPRNCCEWDSKTHTYYINDEDRFRWNVWKDCSFNPIYPQGGTWPFDRAGWCPGTFVDDYEFNLTPLVHPGDTIDFDYGIEFYSDNGEKDGEFQMTHQLVSYGPPNFYNDASITDIIKPTDKDKYARLNPACGNPEIIIQNTGKNNLKSLKIEYGLISGKKSIYEFHGNLKFLEKQCIVLPVPDWSTQEINNTFIVKIIETNGQKDENDFNNTLTSKADIPIVLPNKFIIHVKTNDNNRACENSCIISDSDGKVYYYFDNYKDSTEYYHDIILNPGCYTFQFTDNREDGIMLHWWYYNTDKKLMGISGKVDILSADKKEILYSFPSDFGQELQLNFIIKDNK
ncbi:MAG: hypothetical protein Kow0068_20100 [Marinilabiliales bacterium]